MNTWREKWQQAYEAAGFYTSGNNTREYWNSIAGAGSGLAGSEHISLLIDHLRKEDLLDHNTTITDIGCGSGDYVTALAELCHSITALDYATSMLEACRERCRNSSIDNVSFVLADFESTDISQTSDLVISCLNPVTYNPDAMDKMLSLADKAVIYFSMDTDIENAGTEAVYRGCNSVRFAEEYLKETGKSYIKIPYIYDHRMENGEIRKIPFAYLLIRKQ